MPTQYEREAVMKYCINRELVRPKTNFVTALKYLLIIEILIIALSYCFVNILHWFGISLSYSIVYSITSVGIICASLKKISILLIELYQHYASGQTRRKCTLKPSCSEYSIMALKKYGILKALYKSYNRLFKICKGNVYRIDYP